ncbi:hypothetical protein V5799_015765 [Amblyomma americanum]|uniref:RNase H type-1 domain-containing protein n=1 Tax=Amblyomma americanum TaxID=6943 RepID=A0AAQ4F6X1_AMBAM
MARRTKAASLPHILQWNVRSLRARHAELACLIEDGRLPFDVLALQETNVEPSSLRLPGYLGYAGVTRCTSPGCPSSPCLDPGHQQQGPRSAVYVRAGLPHVVMDLSDAVSGPLEACAVTVRMGATDTTVVSIYIPPGAAPGGSDVRGDLLARVPRPQQGDPSGPELPGPRSYLRPRGYHFGQGPGQFPCPGPPPPEHQGKPQAPGAHCLDHLPACGLDGLPAHRRCLPSTRQTPAPPELDRVSPAKTEALLYHPRGRRAHITTLRLGADGLTWRNQVKYLGLLIDRRLTWLPAVRTLLPRLRRIGQAVQRLQARDKGCSPSWALRLYHAAATSLVTYALPLVTLPPARLRTLELGHRSVLRQCLGLPRISPIAATHAEAGSWPLSLLLLQTGLRHVNRLYHAPDGRALLSRLRRAPDSRMGLLYSTFHRLFGPPVNQAPFPPPPTRPPLPISVDIRSCSRRRTPVAALQQTAATLLQESLGGHLQVYTDGSVLPATGQAAAACVAPALGAALSCRLRFPANSTAAELAGLHLAADLLLLLPGQQPAVILTDSRAALQLLRQHQPRQHTVANLTARLMAIQDAGRPVSLQWLPSHVGITGNEAADQLAGAAHTNGSPVSSKVTQLDFARPALRQAVRALHPDPRVASGVRFMRVPDCLPRRERTLILRLRTGCSWTQARLHRHGRAPSPACSFCGADETLGHLLCACPNLEAARRDMTAGYRNLGLPSYSDQDLPHPERSQTEAFRLLLEFLQSTGLATRL